MTWPGWWRRSMVPAYRSRRGATSTPGWTNPACPRCSAPYGRRAPDRGPGRPRILDLTDPGHALIGGAGNLSNPLPGLLVERATQVLELHMVVAGRTWPCRESLTRTGSQHSAPARPRCLLGRQGPLTVSSPPPGQFVLDPTGGCLGDRVDPRRELGGQLLAE